MAGIHLDITDLTHGFDGRAVLNEFNLIAEPGEVVCLLGPSGCGKSTLLRIVAGLERPWSGSVALNNHAVTSKGIYVPPEARNVGFLFQDFTLFPHLNVGGNVAFGIRDLPAESRRRKVLEALEKVGMSARMGAFPHMLSGGQQQRVALARALVRDPGLMLLDEPFTALDAALRAQVRDQTLHVLKERGVTMLMVTHDSEEAMFMADRIVLMRDGRVVQTGTPRELYSHPINAFAAQFFSETNRFEGVVGRDGRVETPFGPTRPTPLAPGCAVEILIRPEALRLGGQAHLATVLAARHLGRSSLVHLSMAFGDRKYHLHSRVPGIFLPDENSEIGIDLDWEQAFVFPLGAEK